MIDLMLEDAENAAPLVTNHQNEWWQRNAPVWHWTATFPEDPGSLRSCYLILPISYRTSHKQ